MFNSFKYMSDAEYAEMISNIISNFIITVPHLALLIGTFWLSWLAHKHTQDKFRLDLFDRRWKIYKNILEFSRIVMSEGGMPRKRSGESDDDFKARIDDFVNSVTGSFRGEGFHLYKSLFGSELNDDFDKLNNAYAFFITYNEPGSAMTDNVIKEKYELLKFVIGYSDKMPEKFKKYIYFGDVKAK